MGFASCIVAWSLIEGSGPSVVACCLLAAFVVHRVADNATFLGFKVLGCEWEIRLRGRAKKKSKPRP